VVHAGALRRAKAIAIIAATARPVAAAPDRSARGTTSIFDAVGDDAAARGEAWGVGRAIVSFTGVFFTA
jgi:hypothetical protein